MNYTWKDRLKDSSWVTIAWEWFQSLLGRAVDFVLWVTMIFACYQLIPGAPAPDTSVSTFMFILQFVALDIGGMGLRQLAQRHSLDKKAFTYKIAYACILVTFITLIFAGIQHAASVDPEVKTWIEVALVIARSGLTVLYGQAIRALKFIEENEDDKVEQLQADANGFKNELDTARRQVYELRSQLQGAEKSYSLLTNERDRLSIQIGLKEQELSGIREMLSGGQDWSAQQLTKLQERFDAEQELTANLRLQLQSLGLEKNETTAKLQLQLQSVGLQKNDIAENLRTANLRIEGLQRELQAAKLQVEKLQKFAENQTAKNPNRPAKLPANVTAIEDAKQRMSNADILAYITANPGLKRAEVAANLGISERKVYDAIAWRKGQEIENAVSE